MIEILLTTFGASVFAFMVAAIKWLLNIRKDLRDIKTTENKKSRQTQVLFLVQTKQIKAHRATLEVLSGIKSNGNVTAALNELETAENCMNEFANDIAWD